MRRAFFAMVTITALTFLGYGQRTDLAGLKICIDPGHGGNNPANDRYLVPDPGTEFWESESNFRKALLLDTLLRARGATVLLTRTTNSYPNDADEPSLSARVAFANANNVDWFHSIHSNAFNGATNYTLMLVREKIAPGGDPIYGPGMGVPERQESWDMAVIIGTKIRQLLRTSQNVTRLDWTFYGGSNGGYTLGVLRGLLMPGELSEGSFHDYFPETRRLMNNFYRKMEAYALRNSFLQYYGNPADTLGIIAGIQSEYGTGKNINISRARLLPLNRVYTGDSYNNGFYMFDNIPPGTYTVRFETPGYSPDSAVVVVATGSLTFLDRSLLSFAYPTVLAHSPAKNEPAFDASQPVTINFSKPMDTAAVRKAFSITPAVSGSFLWSNSNSTLMFDPDSLLPFFMTFTVRIDTTARSVDSKALDANGDGSPDPFQLAFTTKFVDVIPPQVFSTYPPQAGTVSTTNQVVNVTFNERLNPSTITVSNFVIQEIGGNIQARLLEYWEGGNKGAVNMYFPYGLKAGKSYRMRVTRVGDLAGNIIPAASSLLWDFTIGPDSCQYVLVDSVGGGSSGYKTTAVAGGTAVVSVVSSPKLGLILPNSGAARVDYAWDSIAIDAWAQITVDSMSTARMLKWVAAGHILQAYVFGDGSGNQIQIAVRDSLADGSVRRVLGPPTVLNWVGWRLIEWDFGHDTLLPAQDPPSGIMRFDGFTLRRLPGAPARSGQIGFDLIQLAERILTGVPYAQEVVPLSYALHQNYPNPFNPATVIRYTIAGARDQGIGVSNVSLVIYDLLGREVAVLVNEVKEPGNYTATFDARNLSSGMYFVRMNATPLQGGNRFSAVGKMLLAK
jgi:N-acetylmuramoyl-L-alanine amidase